MPQSSATPDIFDDVAGGSSASSTDIFDQVSGVEPEAKAAKTPAEQEFENKVQSAAIASIPKPAFLEGQPKPVDVLPGAFGFENEGGFGPPKSAPVTLPKYDVQRAVVGGLTDIATGGGMPSNESSPPLGEPMAQGVRELETPGKRGTGALRVAATGAEALSPIMGPGALETGAAIEAAPSLTHAALRALPMTGGMAAGYGTSEAAGPIARKLGADPEQEELIKDLAFWVPSLAGAILQPKFGAAVSPQEVVVRGGVKVPIVGDVAAEVRIPRSQPPAPPAAIDEPIPNAPNAWEAAKGNLNPRTPLPGTPAPPSDDPAVTSMANAHAANETAAKQAAGIPEPPPPTILDQPNAPPELQQNRIAPESIQRMATFVAGLPDAQRAQAVQEAHQTLTAALTEMGKKGPVSLPDGTLALVKDPKSAEKLALSIINDAVKAHDKVSASLSGEGERGKQTGAVSQKEAASGDIFDQAAQTPTEPAKPSPVSQESPQLLKKGDTAVLAKDVTVGSRVLPRGSEVVIRYVHPNNLLVRAEAPDGTKISRGIGFFSRPTTATRGDMVGGVQGQSRQDEATEGTRQSGSDERRLHVGNDGERLSPGASSGNGEGAREAPATVGARSPQEPQQTGQPTRESGSGGPQGAHPEALDTGTKGGGASTSSEELRAGAPNGSKDQGHEKVQSGTGREVRPQALTPAAEPEHPNLNLGEHAAHTEMVPTKTVSEYGKDVEMLPVEELEKLATHDRRKEPFGTDMDELKADIQKNGIKEPLELGYNHAEKKAVIWDGNHRLGVAKELGLKELPVRVKATDFPTANYGKEVAGYKGEGAVPEHLKPSDIGIGARPVKTEAKQEEKQEEKPTKYKFGNTQAPVPANSEASEALKTARDRISDSDLKGKGKETDPHVTVRYGIKGEDTEGIRKFLSQQTPFEATLGKTDKFPPSEHSEGAAVIIAPIEAPELHRLNAELEKHGDFTEPSFREYRPHATIAYVDPDKASRYTGMSVTEGKKFTVDKVYITDRNGNAEAVKLEGKKARRSKEEIDHDIDAVVAKGRERREASQDQSIRGLRPADTDWLSEEENRRLSDLQVERHPYTAEENSTELARQRVAEKRAARQAANAAIAPEPTPAESQRRQLGLPPIPGKVGEINVRDLKVAPSKFQYKLSTDAEGVGTLLKETKVFNPDLAGIISVWKDPADGKTYVINGHHRYELAKRTGQKTVTVRHIVAKDATEARAIGALQNIAEGRGTAIDAAKFFRDTGLTPEDLKGKGISLGEATARDGLALSRLAPEIFNKVVSGELRQGIAKAIGEGTDDVAQQKAIFRQIERRERGGGKVSEERVREFIRLAQGAEKRQENETSLFGTQTVERSLLWEKTEVSEYIKQQLAKDKKLFGFVAKENRATELARAGNKINVEESGRISTEAAQAEEVYNKLSERGGPISSILDQSARRLADGENAATVKSEAYQQVRREVSQTLGGTKDQSAQRSEGAPESLKSAGREASIDFFSEASPLFKPAPGPIEPFTAKQVSFELQKPGNGLPNYLRINPAAADVLSRMMGTRFNGVSMHPQNVETYAGDIEKSAERFENRGMTKDAEPLRKLAEAMRENLDANDGLILIRKMSTPEQELRILREELLHAVLQRRPGKGDIAQGVPWRQVEHQRGFRKIAERIKQHLQAVNASTRPEAIVAEAAIDIISGEAPELTPKESEASAEKYFAELAKMAGIEAIQDTLKVLDHVDKLAADSGIIPQGEQFDGNLIAPARRAAEGVLSRLGGTQPAPSGNQPQEKPVSGNAAPGAGQRSANDTDRSRELGGGGSAPKRTPPGEGNLHSTQPIGLTDEELENWSKSKGFRYEPAGEQLGMFGGNDPLIRVFRQGPRGREQRALVYQNQIDRLTEGKSLPTEPFQLQGGEAREEQPRLFGAGDLGEIIGNPSAEKPKIAPEGKNDFSLFSSERGEADLSKLGKDVRESAETVRDYLREVRRYTELARDLQRGLETLDTQKQADILRAKQVMEDINLPHADDEKLYHHLEDPERVDLTPKQDEILDNVILPIADQNNDLYTELTKGGIPIENYVHRVVKGKGGVLDRIAQGVKAIGQKATLSKSAPQTKSRTYMALEDSRGNRQVVSIKGGQVTAWENGQPENLGGLSHTQEGNVFEDKDGNIWNLQQATTKEIEQHTGTRYYHSALASTLVSNIQLGAAVRAMRFLEAFKSSPEFKQIAFDLKTKGNPPKVWRTTNLPQFNGYAFEARTAEVLDAYYDRMRQGNLGALDQIGKFMRIAMLLNPIMHPMNVAASWAMERGATGFLMPTNYRNAWKAGNKAVKAVLSQNKDFLDALDAGAPLQSHREAIKDITKLFFDQLAEGIGKEEPWAVKVAKALGIEHGNLLNILHKFSSKVAWASNDIFFLQSAYENQLKNPGMSLADALKETGRIIPEYRVPTRILDSQLLSKLMTNRWATIFGSYHYGLLKSFGEVAKSALGAGGSPPKGPRTSSTGGASEEGPQFAGRTRAQEIAKGWDRLALIALITMALYPILDELAKKATGDKHARVRRSGPFGLVDAVAQVVKHEQSVSTAAQRVVTPAPQTKAAAELVFNREFYGGHQIYDPHASFPVQGEQIGRYLLGEMGQIGQVQKAQTTEQKHRFLLGQIGVQMHKTAAEKTAADIAMSKVGTQAEDPADQENRVLRREILDQLRKGNRTPLQDAEAKHEITVKQAKNLERRSHLTPLQDTIHGFSYSEARQVYSVANPEEKKELDPIMRQKRLNMFKAGRSREITSEVQ